MTDSAYLIFNSLGLRRMVKGKRRGFGSPRLTPALNRGEYAVLVTVHVPPAAFKPLPTPAATVTVPESAIIVPDVVVEVAAADV